MKKILLTFFVCLTLGWSQIGNAFVRYEDKQVPLGLEIKVTGFVDYAPFGYRDPKTRQYETAFRPLLDRFRQDLEAKVEFQLDNSNEDERLRDVRNGEIDLVFGLYAQTDRFKGIQVLYPAAFLNPISIFTLPHNVQKITSTDDLKKMKGVRCNCEEMSDFVERKMQPLDLMVVDTPYEMFEKLFTRQVDYIVSSYYFARIEAIKLGIQTQIAPSKQVIWNIPMFVGLSKLSRNREFLAKRFTSYLNDKTVTEALNAKLQDMLVDYENRYLGKVPETFGLEKTEQAAETNSLEKGDNPLDEGEK